ncbi:hypothetical protein B7R54_15265 [Subtercola boreus]|uniref:DUF4214 domain-containing protein n=1 Tax=Subtercola boreus TaxID=120213 RepID=A0A3E0VL16_9MICO|nr:DUF4214 domain-containing protein [Subtercola boreus]RFA10411.1 hypothetical protein B7R54_15265 [Subtercola boreus]TQL56067.1 uncharacterized protein DUF4214 [Subtercola boreus]
MGGRFFAGGAGRRMIAAGAGFALVASVLVVAGPAVAGEAAELPRAAPVAAAQASVVAASPAPTAPPLQPVLHPLAVEPGPAEGSAASPSSSDRGASPQAVGVAASAITGTLNYAERDGGPEVLPGATVTAIRFAADQSVLFQKSVTTADDGTFALTGLPAGDYYVEFTAAVDGEPAASDWYGSTSLNLYGTVIRLADSTEQRIYGFFSRASIITGHISCEQCDSAPDPADVTLELTASHPDPIGIATVRPEADGSYTFTLRTSELWGGFAIYALYSGSEDLSAVSQNPRVFPEYGGTAEQDLLLARDVQVQCSNVGTVPSVHALYWDYLHRSPTESDVRFWCYPAARDGLGVISASFVNSDEYRLIRIDNAYRTILGRAPDAGGRLAWLHGMQGGVLSTDDIETTFYASEEYFLQHGGTNTGFVAALYATLLHRSGTASEYAFWAKLVTQHSRAWVVAQFWDSTETISERVSSMYQLYLGRIPDPGGLDSWVSVALQVGDSGLRAGLTGSGEYASRAEYRYHEVN